MYILIYVSYTYAVPKYREQFGDKTWQFYAACALNIIVILVIVYGTYVLIVVFYGEKGYLSEDGSISDDPSSITGGGKGDNQG